jgi:hypothetical protein
MYMVYNLLSSFAFSLCKDSSRLRKTGFCFSQLVCLSFLPILTTKTSKMHFSVILPFERWKDALKVESHLMHHVILLSLILSYCSTETDPSPSRDTSKMLCYLSPLSRAQASLLVLLSLGLMMEKVSSNRRASFLSNRDENSIKETIKLG